MLNQKEILSTIEMIDQQHLDAENLVKTGEDIEREFGIPIVNKRISVTPMALVAGASETEDYVPFALALDRAA